MMHAGKQAGYMDMQLMPAVMGIVILIGALGLITNPEFNPDNGWLLISVVMFLGTGALLYGYAMHLYALGYPESPFNKHTSPLFMTILCAGPLAFAAYRFYSADMRAGFILYAVLSLLVLMVSFGLAFIRRNSGYN